MIKKETRTQNSKLNILLNKGRSKGFVTYDEILEAIPNAESNIEEVNELYETLESYNININDNADESEAEDLTMEEELENYESELNKSETHVSQDPIKAYLKEIGREKLLTADEETYYAKMVEALRYQEAHEKLKKEGIDEPTDAQLMEELGLEDKKILKEYRAQYDEYINGPLRFQMKKSRNKLVEANLRLVVSFAKKHMHRGLSFSDLIQEGNIGLMKAVEKFDWRKGFKFSTYATWWIRQAITRAIADQARTIRIPVHMIETIHKLKRTQRAMEQKLERDVTAEELAKEMEMEVEKVEEILKISQDTTSLQQKIGPEADTQLSEFIQDTTSISPDQMASYELLKEQFAEVLDTLSERERKVLELRFGLKDSTPRTLEDVGRVFGVTRERIRQIESKALRKLRHPSRAKSLKDYI